MPKRLEVNGNVTGNLLIKVENFEICSPSHQRTSAPRVRRFLFFSFSQLRRVGDGRELEHDSLLRPHSLPGAPYRCDHTGHQKLYCRLKRCSAIFYSRGYSLPNRGFFSVWIHDHFDCFCGDYFCVVHFLAYRSFFFLAMVVNKEVPFTDDVVPDIEFFPLLLKEVSSLVKWFCLMFKTQQI